jgi:ABC-type glycerol-3-phosphate transport system substrate-binding protein
MGAMGPSVKALLALVVALLATAASGLDGVKETLEATTAAASSLDEGKYISYSNLAHGTVTCWSSLNA